MIICPKCGASHNDDTKFCSKCGTNLEPFEKLFCPSCNFEITNPKAKFCKSCGLKFDEEHKPIAKMQDNARKICPHCGSLLQNNNAKFCKVCGGAFTEDKPPLSLGDKDKYYRVCLHCGEVYEIRTGTTVCTKCKNNLELTPRLSPELTDEDKKQVEKWEQREREEHQKRQKLRIQQEKEEKERLERKLEREKELKAKKIAKRKKITKIIIKTCIIVVAVGSVGFGAWIWVDNNNINKAEVALTTNSNYVEALNLYAKINKKSRYYPQAQTRKEEINKAVEAYKKADKSNKMKTAPAYLDAIKYCKEAKQYNTNMPIIDEAYKTAQIGYGKLIDDYIGKEDYKSAANLISGIDIADKTEAIKTAEKTLNDKVKAIYDEGNKLLNEGSLDSALACLNSANEIYPDFKDNTNLKSNLIKAYTDKTAEQYNAGKLDGSVVFLKKAMGIDSNDSEVQRLSKTIAGSYTSQATAKFNAKAMNDAVSLADKALDACQGYADAQTVKENITKYNKYVEYLNKAGGQYGRGEIVNAHYSISDVPTDTVGNMARANFSTLISNVNNDYQYRSKPVEVVSDNASLTIYDYNTHFSYGYVHYTIKNRLNRPVTVRIQTHIKAADDYEQYETYTLSAHQTLSDSMYYNPVYMGYSRKYSYGVNVDSFTIN